MSAEEARAKLPKWIVDVVDAEYDRRISEMARSYVAPSGAVTISYGLPEGTPMRDCVQCGKQSHLAMYGFHICLACEMAAGDGDPQ